MKICAYYFFEITIWLICKSLQQGIGKLLGALAANLSVSVSFSAVAWISFLCQSLLICFILFFIDSIFLFSSLWHSYGLCGPYFLCFWLRNMPPAATISLKSRTRKGEHEWDISLFSTVIGLAPLFNQLCSLSYFSGS